jgi:DNA-binding PadR family transcriptional regulator
MDFGPRFFKDLFGDAMPWDPDDWGRRRRHRSRFFERGDLRLVILDLLAEKPRHGYEIIRALEERSGGFYAPSPGSVYPTLQLLEDVGHVTASQQGEKRVYAITDEGRAHLAEQRDSLDDIWGRFGGQWGYRGHGGHRGHRGHWDQEVAAELQGCWHEFGRIARLVAQRLAAGRVDAAGLRRIREVLVEAARQIEEILRDQRERQRGGDAADLGNTRMV